MAAVRVSAAPSRHAGAEEVQGGEGGHRALPIHRANATDRVAPEEKHRRDRRKRVVLDRAGARGRSCSSAR